MSMTRCPCGFGAYDCDQCKEPATEQGEDKSVSCSLVSLTRIYVMANVFGKPIQCLLDSRCECSVIARSLVPNARLVRSRYNLSVANKTNLPILGDTDLHFTMDGHEFEANVLVSLAIDDFLLGSDWLVKNGAKWDFAASTISFGDQVVHAFGVR